MSNDTYNGTDINPSTPESHSVNPIVTIIEASVSSTLENMFAITVGVILSHPKLGLLGKKDVVQTISKMLLFVFLPFFVISSFGTSVKISMMLEMWVIVVLSFLMHVIQYGMAELFMLSSEERRKSTHRMIPLLSMTYTNFTFIPMVFLTSLCQNSNIFQIEDAEQLSQVFVTLYAIPQRIAFYSVGIYLIKSMDSEENSGQVSLLDSNNPMETIQEHEEKENEEEDEKSSSKRLKIRVFKKLKSVWLFVRFCIFSPPVLAIGVGFIICAIPPVQDFVFSNPPILIKGIPNVFKKLGNIVLGLANIITGANVGRLIFSRNSFNSERKKKKKKSIKSRIRMFLSKFKFRYVDACSILKVTSVKLVLSPMVCLVIIALFSATLGGLVISEDYRSLLYMVVLVESMVPLMLSLNIVVSVYDNGIEILSEYLITQYLLAPFTMTFFSVVSLYFVCSFEKCDL